MPASGERLASGLRALGYGEVLLYLRLPVGWIILLIAGGLGATTHHTPMK